MDLVWELRAVLVVVVLAFLAPNTGCQLARLVGRPFRKLAMHRRTTVVLVGLSSLTLTAWLGITAGWPKPYIHDEFAYALTGDTFAHGRLTNPTHPMWEHFESFHIIHQPSYQSKYPPGQGLMLALGQVLTGRQIVGVWISVALACAATCWMLQGWLPPRWALLGGVLTIIHPTVVVWWGETYWGGAVAMLGGALVYGALPRLRKEPSALHGVLIALGLLLLANSRPYEGLVVSLPAAVAYALWLFRSSTAPLRTRIVRVTVPLLAVLTAGAAAMGFYNYRVTGSATTLPYQVWMQQYTPGMAMNRLLWKSGSSASPSEADGSPVAAETTFDAASMPGGTSADNWVTPPIRQKLLKHHLYFFRVILTLSLLALPWLLNRRDVRFALTVYLCVAASVILNACSGNSHYYAPGTALLVLLMLFGIRRLRLARIGRLRWGHLIAVSLVPITAATSLSFARDWASRPVETGYEWVLERERIVNELTELGGRHVVLVHYRAGHLAYIEWVYNSSDLEQAPILWARPLSPERTAKLMAYYQDRVFWRLDADDPQPHLVRLPRENSPDNDASHQQRVTAEPDAHAPPGALMSDSFP